MEGIDILRVSGCPFPSHPETRVAYDGLYGCALTGCKCLFCSWRVDARPCRDAYVSFFLLGGFLC